MHSHSYTEKDTDTYIAGRTNLSLPYRGWCTSSTCHWSPALFGLKVTFLYSVWFTSLYLWILQIFRQLSNQKDCLLNGGFHVYKLTLIFTSAGNAPLSSAMFVLFTWVKIKKKTTPMYIFMCLRQP